MLWSSLSRRVVAVAMLAPLWGVPGQAAEPRLAAATPGAGTGPAATTSGREAVLPRILGDADAAAYTLIFELQDAGHWIEADRAIAKLKDKRLLGHVLAQRYLAPNYRSRYVELEAWLARYGDHPQAPRLYDLALRRKPAGVKDPQAPSITPRNGLSETAGTAADDDGPGEFAEVPAPALDDADMAEAEAAEDSAAAISPAAPSKLSVKAAWRAWFSGLAAWRKERYGDAARLFEAVGGAPSADPWLKSAGYFWAARASHAAGQPRRYVEMMQQAALYPRSFYGLLARQALGMDFGLDFQRPRLAAADAQALAQQPSVQRILALAQIGQFDRADHELRMAAGNAIGTPQALIALADRIGTPAAALDMAQRLLDEDGVAVDAALYPTMPWGGAAAGEFGIDAALLHALVRQESGFRPRAVSHAGARGLMQLMPATGRFIARAINAREPSHERLYDPAVNLLLGQAYISHLFRDDAIGPDLSKMVAAYNGGPGNLRKWERSNGDHGDPLLFIESIPVSETRMFVERVLANMWIYRIRFGQSSPSLDALAAGAWPGYDPQSGTGVAEQAQAN